jgi:hypothetical protein
LALLHFLTHLDTSDWIAIAATFVALISAIAAARSNAIARAANKLADEANELSKRANSISGESNTIAREANAISEEARDLVARGLELDEAAHVERERERAARAVLTARVEPTVFQLGGSHAQLPITLIIENEGERAAGVTKVELLVPNHVTSTSFVWEEELNRRDRARARTARDVTLIDDQGREFGVWALEREIPNITSAMPARLAFLMPIQLPPERQTYPLRVVAHAEHAAEPLVADLSVTVVRGAG